MTDAELAYQVVAPGVVITRTPQQIAAYKAQNQTLGDFMAQMNGGVPGGAGASAGAARFSSGLSDAEARLKALLDDPNSIQQTAGYKFRVQQGQDALERSLGARGMLRSGNRLKELTQYGQDMASQEYDNQANRLSNLLGTYGQFYNQGRSIDTNANLGALSAWSRQQASQPVVRSSGGFSFDNPGVFGGGGNTVSDLWSDPTIARLRNSRNDAYNY